MLLALFRKKDEVSAANLVIGTFQYLYSELLDMGFSVECEDSAFYVLEDEYVCNGKLVYGNYSYDVMVVKGKELGDGVVCIKYSVISKVMNDIPFMGDKLYLLVREDDKTKSRHMVGMLIISVVSFVFSLYLCVHMVEAFFYNLYGTKDFVIGILLTISVMSIDYFATTKFLNLMMFRVDI